MSGIQKPVPSTTDNYIGIEIEFDLPSPWQDTFAVLKQEVETIIPDATVHREHVAFKDNKDVYAFEASLLCKEDGYEMHVIMLIDLLKKHGASVSELHGLHVHVDARQRMMDEMMDNITKFEGYLFKLCAEHRQENEYCIRGETHKHGAIHISSAYHTLEIRMKEALLDDEAICNWVALIVNIINGDTKLSDVVGGL